MLRTVLGTEKVLDEGEPLSAISVAVSSYTDEHLEGSKRSSSFLFIKKNIFFGRPVWHVGS